MSAPELSRIVKASEIGSTARSIVVESTPQERAALAVRFGLLALDALSAEVSVRQEAAGIRATGRVRAAATQPCVISGEPVPEAIDSPLDLLFAPETPHEADDEVELSESECDVLPFDGQAVDIGEAVAQSLSLALDPYPRAEGAAVAEAREHLLTEEQVIAARSPFAALRGTTGNDAD